MFFRKKSPLFLLCVSFSFLCFGQIQIEGKIFDADNGNALPQVQISHITNHSTFFSDNKGIFKVLQSGVYIFKKEGYYEKTVTLNKNQHFLIQLHINPSQLNEVVINSNHIQKKLKTTSVTTNIITNSDIKRGNNVNIAPILNKVPGILMQTGALNTNRITIRGIGARNLFGTAKIRAYFNDIPLTNGSGETTIEDFELNTISRIEIIKGAISNNYGTGLGGAIRITPKIAALNQTNVNAEFTVGDFGLFKKTFQASHGGNIHNFNATYSKTHSDGYRENNTYDRQTWTLSTKHTLNDNNKLSFLGSYVDLKAFIPSSINKETFDNDPKSAAFTWKQAQGFEDTQRGIFGLTWTHQYHSKLQQHSSIFANFRNTYEPRPFNILEENTHALGLRSRLLGQNNLFNKLLQWTIGTELFNEQYNWETFENRYLEFPVGTGSVEGNKLSNFKEQRNYYNLFLDINYNLSSQTTLSLGLNFNNTSYELEDKFPVTNDNPDQSGSYKFKDILSPTIGLSHQLFKNINLYANTSHGFSPISLEETLLPDGQINTSLKPETGWNFEIGTRTTFLQDRLQCNLALYRLSIKNLLVSRRLAEDQFIGINAGKTQHDGVEIDVIYQWINTRNITLNTFVNYAWNNFKFKTFIDGNNNFSGNDLTGVPSNVYNAGIDILSKQGLYGNLNLQYVGKMPITDSNDIFSNAYTLTHLKTGYKRQLYNKINLNVFLGINNIFNETYASQILINASGFNGNAPRYYYPGNPFNYYTGVNLNYIF